MKGRFVRAETAAAIGVSGLHPFRYEILGRREPEEDLMPPSVNDEVRAARCIVPVSIYPPGMPGQSVAVSALIDTGATASAITQRFAGFVGLPMLGQELVSGSGRSAVVPMYQADLEIWKPGYDTSQAHVFKGRRLTTLLSAVVGFHVLLGMDILERNAFLIDPDGRWTLTF